MENFGMRVDTTIMFGDEEAQVTLHNITEICYYQSLKTNHIAFESDLHGTGITYNIEEVVEFTVKPEETISDAF